MIPSSQLCRAQEDLHRRRASETDLENVRTVATAAAIAWGREALDAERREARQARTKLLAEGDGGDASSFAAANEDELDEAEAERGFDELDEDDVVASHADESVSENPDRGLPEHDPETAAR